MPVLPNPRHERFAQELAAGKSAIEAHKLAGYKPDKGTASRLQHDINISQRVGEILDIRDKKEAQAIERAIERTAISKERVIRELAKIGFSNMLDYMQVGPDGDPVLNFAALTRDQAAALSEVTVEDFKDGRGGDARDVRRVKFKLADKRTALVDLGREIGMFIDRKHVTHQNVPAAEMEFEQLLAIAQGRVIEHRADEAVPDSATDVSEEDGSDDG